jgi:hypothetical protein
MARGRASCRSNPEQAPLSLVTPSLILLAAVKLRAGYPRTFVALTPRQFLAETAQGDPNRADRTLPLSEPSANDWHSEQNKDSGDAS